MQSKFFAVVFFFLFSAGCAVSSCPEKWPLPWSSFGTREEGFCCLQPPLMLMICFLPVSASFSGDGASSVGRAPSLGPHKGDLLLQGKVMLGSEGGGRTPSWSLEEQVNPAQCGCPRAGGWGQWVAGGCAKLGTEGPLLMALSWYPWAGGLEFLWLQSDQWNLDLPAG